MNVGFRVDSSARIGTGHMMRCLALADALAERGARVAFITGTSIPGLVSVARGKGHRVVELPVVPAAPADPALRACAHEDWLASPWDRDADATRAALESAFEHQLVDWLIVDHYGIDHRWESAVRPAVRGLMVIDDLADRAHACDVVLDQSHLPAPDQRYRGLVEPSTALLLGPRHALLRKEFANRRRAGVDPRVSVHAIFVCYGGVDATDETSKAIDALEEPCARGAFRVDVVISPTQAAHAKVRERIRGRAGFRELAGNTDLAPAMADADLGLGAGGVMTWERCSVGLPVIVTAVARNQIEIAAYADVSGYAVYAGEAETVTSGMLEQHIAALAKRPERLTRMSSIALEITDGLGAERVAQFLGEATSSRRVGQSWVPR